MIGLNCWDPMDDGLYIVVSTINIQLMCLYIYIFMEPSSSGNLRVFDMPRMDKFYYYFFSIYINKW